MAVTNNIGKTSRIITQRDFIRNLSEFYLQESCTDNEVDNIAPKLITSNENIFIWPNGSTYEPLKALPNFTVNKTGTTKPFWNVVGDAVGDERLITKTFPEYTVEPFKTTGVNEKQLVPESACTTVYDTTMQMYGDSIKFVFKDFTLSPNVVLDDYDINNLQISVSASTIVESTALNVITGKTLFGVYDSNKNNKSLNTGGTMSPYGGNYLVIADKSLQSSTIQIPINIVCNIPPKNTTTGVPLTLATVPTFSDQNGKNLYHPSATITPNGSSTNPVKKYSAPLRYQNPITYGNLPDTIYISAQFGKQGNYTNVYLSKLAGKKPDNFTGMTFTSYNSSIGEVSIKLDDGVYINEIKPKWCLGFAQLVGQEYAMFPDFGGVTTPVSAITYPFVDDMGSGSTGVHHLVKYNVSTSTVTEYGAIPSPIIQLPRGIWIVPTYASTSSAGTPTTAYTKANQTNIYASQVNAYMAAQLKVVGGSIQIGSSVSSVGEGTYDVLVPCQFQVREYRGSSNLSIKLIYTDVNGASKTTGVSGTRDSNGIYTIKWDPYNLGGDILEITVQ